MNDITFIIRCTGFRPQDTDRTLQSLALQTVFPREVLLIYAEEEAAALPSREFPFAIHEIRAAASSEGAQWNAALQAAQGDVVCFLSAGDVIPDATALEFASRRLARSGSSILIGNYALFAENQAPGAGVPSPFAHCLREADNISLADDADLLGAMPLHGKFISRSFLQTQQIAFDENTSLPHVRFHIDCCLRNALFSLTERCLVRHAEGALLRVAQADSCLREIKDLSDAFAYAKEKLSPDAYGRLQEYTLYRCLQHSLKETVCMTEEQRPAALERWQACLAAVEPSLCASPWNDEERAYLSALRDGKIQEAQSALSGEHADQIGKTALFAARHDREGMLRDYYLPRRLRDVYARMPAPKRPERPSTPFTVQEDSRILVRWGNGYAEALDPRSRTRIPLSQEIRQQPSLPLHLKTLFKDSSGQPDAPSQDSARPIRVLTLCSTAHGGAGEGSLRRVKALRALGIDARLISIDCERDEDFVGRVIPSLDGLNTLSLATTWRAIRDKVALSDMQGFRGHEFFPSAFSAVDFRQLAPLTDWADIVHLHWIDGMLDYRHMPEVLGNKPVFWTLSAMNPFTGGCHYSEGCQGFRRQCRNCPQMPASASHMPHETWRLRNDIYHRLNLTAICPSPGMAALGRASSLLCHVPVHWIPNAYPVDHFIPLDRAESRRYLNLPQDRPLLAFGATAQHVPRKGCELLRESLRKLKEIAPELARRLLVVTFGMDAFECDCETYRMGFVPQTFLPILYSAADATAVPSIEDTGPMTIGESLLCGTPVVGYSSLSLLGALGRHKETVYEVEPFDSMDFACGLQWALSQPRDMEYRKTIRDLAEQECSPELAAQRHAALYRQALRREENAGDMATERRPHFSIPQNPAQFTHDFIENLPAPDRKDSNMVKRHWVVRRENREENASFFTPATDFNDFTYSRRSHMQQLIQGYLINPDKSEVDPAICDLKAYQDALCTAFIDQMFPDGNARILEIGGGISRILAHYGAHNMHECWNIDKFEGVGNGPNWLPERHKYRIVQKYMGEFCEELPDEYFDFVFSSSVLEHVPDQEAVYKNIFEDIQRVLKPGGYSLHLLDFGYKAPAASPMPGMASYLFAHAPTLNRFVEPEKAAYRDDFYWMSQYRYDWRWKPVLQMPYATHGKPMSINIFWKKM